MPDLGILMLAGAVAAGLLAWRWQARSARARKVRRQDALKQILLKDLEGQPTKMDGLAHRLGLTAAHLASVVDDLASTGHLSVTGDEIRLTLLGRQEAIRVVRAHRLWERHLADDTGFAETDWHAMADRQEHRLTAAETEALARRLGQPASDPHGDPIPTAAGEVVLHEGRPLSDLPVGATARITHIEDEPAEIYQAIIAAGLMPDILVRLLEIEPTGVLVLANGEQHRLPAGAAANIAVLPVALEAPIEAPAGGPLHALQVGERAEVLRLSPRCHGAERRRMLDLGILPGTVIEAVMKSPSGDPTAYRIRDALIALRREQADLIRIARPIEERR